MQRTGTDAEVSVKGSIDGAADANADALLMDA